MRVTYKLHDSLRSAGRTIATFKAANVPKTNEFVNVDGWPYLVFGRTLVQSSIDGETYHINVVRAYDPRRGAPNDDNIVDDTDSVIVKEFLRENGKELHDHAYDPRGNLLPAIRFLLARTDSGTSLTEGQFAEAVWLMNHSTLSSCKKYVIYESIIKHRDIEYTLSHEGTIVKR